MVSIQDQQLWAITSYFNPMGYRRRLTNYHVFRRHLRVPLVTVEWSWAGGQGFQLGPDDADVLVQVASPDLLWQKERLLNLALAALPATCRYVAWIDCDVVLEDPEWPALAGRELERHAIVHLASSAVDLAPDQVLDERGQPVGDMPKEKLSSVLAVELGMIGDELLAGTLRQEGYFTGLAWAARRQLFQEQGFYDPCPVGGGDRAILSAANGQTEPTIEYLKMNAAWARHYQAWAGEVEQSTGGLIGCVPGRIYHLWHGDFINRRYGGRYEDFVGYEFDPTVDLALDESGCWRWASDKPGMHRYVHDYFVGRREDG